ncbi:helix-turn-helix domain-containing protein [Nocardia thailandica]|uniref:helix-turn-helix domain-containing protein n=1 Tax=Nocardia thailandica TaxID=257275 RepID=UPI000313E37F|nr:helix-turn-helix domain-containing protein [Nocardia thailandica]
MAARDETSPEPSPPTQRVVSVLEFLAAADAPRTAAQIADGLRLSRSTVGAILSALRERHWVSRGDDLTYLIGPGLARLAERHRRDPDPVGDALTRLARGAGCGVALIRVAGDEVRFEAVDDSAGPVPAGIRAGTRLPLIAPAAATIVAAAADDVRHRWLAGAPDPARYAELLGDIALSGAAVWGIDAAGLTLLDVLAEVVEHLDHDRAGGRLRARVQQLLAGIGGEPYRAADLDLDRPLPVSYLSTPVRGPGNTVVAELLLGPLRAAVTKPERDRYLGTVRATAREIGAHLPAGDAAGS